MLEFSGKLAASLWPFCTALGLIGCLYALFAAETVRRFAASLPQPVARDALPGSSGISILKPLHGAEPSLAANLDSLLHQTYAGPVQILFGVQDPNDPAIPVVEALIAANPGIDLRLVVDTRLHGTNRKVSNLINLFEHATHDTIVLADSDIVVTVDYLARLIDSLEQPGVGLVTCLYRGLPTRNLWSRLSALAVDYHFTPSVLVGLRLGLANPCFGSTIALRRDTLARIGGFNGVADQLADDYALGAKVRALGLMIAIPPLIVGHVSSETTFKALFAHDLRWARTIRLVDPTGHLGSVATHALPFALLAALLKPGLIGFGLIGLALACRLVLQIQVDRFLETGRGRWRLGPLRDIVSFWVFVASLFPGAITWRGHRYGVRRDGRMTTPDT